MELPKKFRGQALPSAMNTFTGVILGALVLMVALFVMVTLNTSLDNAKVGEVVDDVLIATTNFTTQLGTVGTIAGVALILLVIGGGAYYAMGSTRKGSGV